MNTFIIIACAVSLLICFKWLVVFLYLPLMFFNSRMVQQGGIVRKILAAPYIILERMTKTGLSRYVLFNIGLVPSVSVRRFMYRLSGVQMGKRCVFHWRTEIRNPEMLTVGNGSIIGDNALLDAHRYLVIGNNVNISSNVSIYTGQHDYRSPKFASDLRKPMKVTIGDRAWLGCNVIVLPGVKIGEGAVCCAGCVVTKDVAPYDVVAGIPAKKVAERPRCLTYEFDGKTCWFY